MNKKYLKKNDIKLIKMKNKLILDIKAFIINKGIPDDDIDFDRWDNTLSIWTDERWNNWYILEGLKELHLESVEINSSSDKSTEISIK